MQRVSVLKMKILSLVVEVFPFLCYFSTGGCMKQPKCDTSCRSICHLPAFTVCSPLCIAKLHC